MWLAGIPRRLTVSLSKSNSIYVDALPSWLSPATGRLHTTFDQTGTATGRLSSANPNLQNIPVRTEVGREIRAAFTAEPGHVLLAAPLFLDLLWPLFLLARKSVV